MDWISFLFTGWGVGFTAYVVLQGVTLAFVTGYHGKLVWIPIPFMALVLVLTISAYFQESNLWPVALIICSPLAVLYLALVSLFAGIARAKASQSPTASNDA
jgi:hypothetical protein